MARSLHGTTTFWTMAHASARSRDQLEARAPHIVSLQAILQTARRYNIGNADRLTGLLTVDLKPSSPLCDPDDMREGPFVENVIAIIRRMRASELIYFKSMSPVLLGMAAERAPEIPRRLTVLVLQLLSPQQVEAATGLPVTLIEQDPDYGLQWAEVGVIHRLPGYTSPQQAIATAFATGSRMISYDLLLLGHLVADGGWRRRASRAADAGAGAARHGRRCLDDERLAIRRVARRSRALRERCPSRCQPSAATAVNPSLP
jgi:hypothetical protein